MNQVRVEGIFWAVVVIVLLFFLLALSLHPAKAQVSVSGQTSATSEPVASGYALVLSGDQSTISYVCSFGDCAQTFVSPLAAVNEWMRLFGLAYGLNIVPIPPPMP